MIEVLLTLIPSICWLVFRCYQLFQTLTDQLARQLNVEIPHTPVVCIDQLGSSHTYLHWDIDASPDENIFFVLLVNGKDAGTLVNNSAKLSNLAPDTLYIIQVLAVNAINNFRSQSTAVFIHTLPENTDGNKISLEMDPLSSSTKEVDIPCSVKESDVREIPSELTPGEVDSISNEKTLVRYLIFYLNELKRVRRETHQASLHQRKEEDALKSTIENYKKEFNEGFDFRAKKDVDLKGLENRKSTLTFQKLKLSKQLKSFESIQNLHITNLAEMQSKVAKLIEKHHHMINTNKTESIRCTEQIGQLRKNIADTRESISAIEEAVKRLTSERKILSTTASSLELLVKQFISPPSPASPDGQSFTGSSNFAEMISRDGILTNLGAEVISQICELKPEWEAEIRRELDTLASMENSWKTEFRNAIQRFLAFHNSLELFRGKKDPGYEPKCLTEYSASVEFGGFANALPKFGSKRKNQFVEEDLSFSSPSPDGSIDNGYNHFAQIYENQNVKSTGSFLHSGYETNKNMPQLQPVLLGTPVNLLYDQFPQLPTMGHSQLNDFATSDQKDIGVGVASLTSQANYMGTGYAEQFQDAGRLAQQEGLLNQQYYQPKYQAEHASDFRMEYQPEYHTEHPNNYQTEYQQVYSPDYRHEFASDYQEYPKEYQEYPESYQEYPRDSEYPDPQMTRLEVPGSIPPSSMQQYAQNIRQSFPCEDPVFRTSSPEGNFLYPSVQNTLWQNSSQASFRDMRPFLGISLLPSSPHMDLAMPALQTNTLPNTMGNTLPSTLPNDNGLFSSLLLTTSNSQLSNNIWLDRPMGTAASQKHNRNVSGGSLLWRQDMRNDVSPLGLMSEFSPFAPERTTDGEADKVV